MQTSRQPQRKRPRVDLKMIKRKESKYIITPKKPHQIFVEDSKKERGTKKPQKWQKTINTAAIISPFV